MHSTQRYNGQGCWQMREVANRTSACQFVPSGFNSLNLASRAASASSGVLQVPVLQC